MRKKKCTAVIVAIVCATMILTLNPGQPQGATNNPRVYTTGLPAIGPRSSLQPDHASPSLATKGVTDRPNLNASSGNFNVTIPVGAQPADVAYDNGKGEIFVTNECGWGYCLGYGTVSVISDKTNTVVATITVGSDPGGVVYDGGKGEVFVANHYSNNVTVINDTSNKVVATVPVGNGPGDVAYDSGKGEVFLTNANSNNLSVINDSSNSIVASIPLWNNPSSVAYDSGKGEVFVANAGSNNVSVVSDRTNTVLATVSVGTGPYNVAYDSGKGEIYVSNGGTYNAPGNTVSVISDTTNTVTATVRVGTAPGHAAYDKIEHEVIVANVYSNNISIINDVTLKVVAAVPVGTWPDGVAYDSSKSEVFVSNLKSNTVNEIPLYLSVIAAANPTSGPAYLHVNFSALTMGGSWVYSWAWAFGDGNTSTFQNTSHSFTTAGSYLASVVVTDSSGTIAKSSPIWINVSHPASFIATTAATRTAVDIGEPFWVNTTFMGGVSPFTFVYTTPPPSGAGCPSSPGSSLMCVPTQIVQRFNIAFRVTDAYGATANSTTLNLSVDGYALTENPSVSNSTPWLGQSIYLNVTPSGGVGPYGYSYLGLPPGCISINSSSVGCLPTQSGNYNITVVVTDHNHDRASGTTNVQVIFDFTVVAPSQTPVGQVMTIRVEAPQGIGILSYGYSGLPPGCASQNSATLTCTPTKLGTYSVLVSVRDTAGDHNVHTVAVHVISPSGFLGFSGNEGYYLVASLVGGVIIVLVVVKVVSRRKQRSATTSELKSEADGNYRRAAVEPGPMEVLLLDEGETDPASDLY